MSQNLNFFALGAAVILLAGCATPPESLKADPVSTSIYSDLNCAQVSDEADRVDTRLKVLYAAVRKKANADEIQANIGLFFFWPALILLEGGDGDEAIEYSRLKGERDALTRAALEKRCTVYIPK